jgi:alkylated DNA repair dioxygenase AlkB
VWWAEDETRGLGGRGQVGIARSAMDDVLVEVPGLRYVPAYVPPEQERELLAAIDGALWLRDLKRRVQHHGYRYDYRARKVDRSDYLGPLPRWAQSLAERLLAEGFMPSPADQLIVNEHEPGQGISPHVDCRPCFGPVICSASRPLKKAHLRRWRARAALRRTHHVRLAPRIARRLASRPF